MKPSQCIEFIKKIEAGFPVNRWEMQGIHIWPLIRLDLAAQILLEEANKPTGASFHSRPTGIIAKLLAVATDLCRLLVASFVDARGNARIREKVDAVFLTYSTDRVDLEGKYYNRLSDPLVELMQSIGMSSFTLEKSTAQQYRFPRYYGLNTYSWQLLWHISGLCSLANSVSLFIVIWTISKISVDI